MSYEIRGIPLWPESYLPAGGLLIFYDPDTDLEYRALPGQLLDLSGLGGSAGTGGQLVVTDLPGARGLLADPAAGTPGNVQRGSPYLIYGDWNATGTDAGVYVEGIERGGFSPVGILLKPDGSRSFVDVDVVAGTAVAHGGGSNFITFDLLNPPTSVIDAVRDPTNVWAYGDLTAYGSADLQDAGAPPAVAGQHSSVLVGSAELHTGQGFDAFERGSTTIAWRYFYGRRNDGSSGWTRIGKTA